MLSEVEDEPDFSHYNEPVKDKEIFYDDFANASFPYENVASKPTVDSIDLVLVHEVAFVLVMEFDLCIVFSS